MPVCRISDDDGRPILSIPERDDQNLLFARSLKAHGAASGAALGAKNLEAEAKAPENGANS